MNSENSDPRTRTAAAAREDEIRPHVYDGIQEFDKRLPNWWLWTLYGAIIFSFGYWFIMHQAGGNFSPEARVASELAALKARAAANATGPLSDEQMWALSADKATVAAGRDTYQSTCASCHGPELEGGIGLNLADATWVHGGNPADIVNTVTNGVLDKGMPAWGPVLGEKRVQEVAAFVLSHHTPPQQ